MLGLIELPFQYKSRVNEKQCLRYAIVLLLLKLSYCLFECFTFFIANYLFSKLHQSNIFFVLFSVLQHLYFTLKC